MGFTHKKITPHHLKAQRQVEGFNKLVNKTAAIACAEGVDLHEATCSKHTGRHPTPQQPHISDYLIEQFVPSSTITQQRKQVGTKKSGSETPNTNRN